MPALPYVANAVISGVLTGTVYGLMALGLSAIFGVIRLVNFAHGELMTLAMYGAVAAFQGLALDPTPGDTRRWAGVPLHGCDEEQGCFDVVNASTTSGTA